MLYCIITTVYWSYMISLINRTDPLISYKPTCLSFAGPNL